MARLPHVQTNPDCFLNGANGPGSPFMHVFGIISENGRGEGTDCQHEILGFWGTYPYFGGDAGFYFWVKFIVLYNL